MYLDDHVGKNHALLHQNCSFAYVMIRSCFRHTDFSTSCAHNFSNRSIERAHFYHYSTIIYLTIITTMKVNTAYLNNKRISDGHFFLCTPGNNSLPTNSEATPTKRAKTFKLQPRRSALVIGCALALLLVSSPSADAFANIHASRNNISTQLSYRSLHHGPDVEPLTDIEKLGVDFTKMPKDKLDRFGPGNFDQYTDSTSNDFDGGDSETGVVGDGQSGLRQFGYDVSPHLANTMAARYSSAYDEVETSPTTAMSYAEELMHRNPSMDEIRAVQLQNWATQQEIASANRYMNEKIQVYYDADYDYTDYSVTSLDHLPMEVEAGEETADCLITLAAPLYGVASHEIAVKNPYMGFAKFRTYFVGDAAAEWTVTPSDGYLKQNEATHFVISYRPQNPGVVHGYFVIETEDFKNVWKVVGSTGEYEF